MQEWMRWQPDRPRRLASLVLAPARIVVGVGAAAAVVAGFMPWAEGRAPGHTGFEPVFFSGLGGAGDGLMLVILAAATGLLTLHRLPAASRVRTVRLAPAVTLVLAGLTWLNGLRGAVEAIASWERRGGSGGIAPGLWLGLGGILLMAAGTAWLLPPVLRWQPAEGDPADLVRIGRRDVAEAAGGVFGTFLGGGAGILGALALTGPTIVGAIALGAVFGGLLGAYAGAWAARTAVDEAGGRHGA